jgi:hypothetical protein
MDKVHQIQPFFAYSKRYRSELNKEKKLNIRKEWMASLPNIEGPPSPTTETCPFCFKADVIDCNKQVYCSECLFPCQENICVFVPLSVCYLEHKQVDDNTEAVWRQRLKMAWWMNAEHKDRYTIVLQKCPQCDTRCENYRQSYSSYSDELFCNHCLFPLF